MANRKCIICGNYILDDKESIPYKSRHAHKDCFNNLMKLQLSAKQKEQKEKVSAKKSSSKSKIAEPKILKEAMSEEEFKDKQELFSYIRKLIISEDEISVKTYALIDSYVKKYKFTYSGMLAAMKYFYEIKKNEIQDDGVGILPYIYSESERYYSEIAKTQEMNVEITNTTVLMQKRVRINPNQNKYNPNLIDIGAIGVEGKND